MAAIFSLKQCYWLMRECEWAEKDLRGVHGCLPFVKVNRLGWPLNNGKGRVLTCRAVKRAGPSEKVWCLRLGSTKTRRLQLLTLELRFLKKLHETPFYVNQQLFSVFFVLRQWEKMSFLGLKTGPQIPPYEWVRSPRASCTRKLSTYE